MIDVLEEVRRVVQNDYCAKVSKGVKYKHLVAGLSPSLFSNVMRVLIATITTLKVNKQEIESAIDIPHFSYK